MGWASFPWLYPALEVVHLLGISLLLGNLVALELRVLGWGRTLPLRALASLSLGLACAGFGLAAASGLSLFAMQASEMLSNPRFGLKMGLIALAGCNAAWFHGRGSLVRDDVLARVLVCVSMVLWLAVLALGRWIAY